MFILFSVYDFVRVTTAFLKDVGVETVREDCNFIVYDFNVFELC